MRPYIMKTHKHNVYHRLITTCLMFALLLGSASLMAQDESATEKKPEKPVKYTFDGNMIIDNQTVMIPVKGTFEMTINHRFGVWKNGYEDLYGIFAPANISLGFNYTPIENLQLGINLIKTNMVWMGTAKYALFKQTPGTWKQASVTYYGTIDVDSRDEQYFEYSSHRLMYFNQLLIARKITDRLSLQIAPSLTYNNYVQGYYEGNDTTVVKQEMQHYHLALAVSGKFKIVEGISLLANYDQPLTNHEKVNPKPNLSAGIEFTTSGHSFQIFFGNYSYISPAKNNYWNKNDYGNNEFLIGFNINRTWNF